MRLTINHKQESYTVDAKDTTELEALVNMAQKVLGRGGIKMVVIDNHYTYMTPQEMQEYLTPKDPGTPPTP